MAIESSTSPRRDADWVARQLRVHKRLRLSALVATSILALGVVLGWLFLRDPIDYRHFDGRRYTVAEVIDGDTFALADEARTRVSLLGVDAPEWPDAHYSRESAGYLSSRLAGKVVLLRLDGTQTRNELGRLLAYVYLTDTDMVNADVIRDGRGFSDRRVGHTYRRQFDQLENESRGKARGLWGAISDDDMPSWRLEWLRSKR